MSDLFEEVQHEVRRDRLSRLARRYWKPAAGIVVLALGAAVAVVLVDQAREAARQERAQAYAAALEAAAAGKSEAAAEAFGALAEEAGNEGYGILARLRAAAALTEAGRTEEALAAYDALAAEEGAETLYRNVAQIFAAMLVLDSAPLEEIERRLRPLAESDGAWHPLAREMLAVAYLRAGDRAAARALIEGLPDDPLVSSTARARIEELQSILGAAEGNAP